MQKNVYVLRITDSILVNARYPSGYGIAAHHGISDFSSI